MTDEVIYLLRIIDVIGQDEGRHERPEDEDYDLDKDLAESVFVFASLEFKNVIE